MYQKEILVTKAHIDVLGHVNNREYILWMEEAAQADATRLGWGLNQLQAHAVLWVARQHWIEYLSPCYEGETLVMYTWVDKHRRTSLLRRYALKRGDQLVMLGATEWVLINEQTLRPCGITPQMVQDFEQQLPKEGELRTLGIDRNIRFTPSVGLF